MAKLMWAQPGERLFETGVDRGVFYPQSGVGVAWSGLISVTEAVEGGENAAYYLDGTKYLNLTEGEDFAGTIEAYGPPPGFAAYDGVASIGSSLFITQQPRRAFGLSYRTIVGNDTEGVSHGYKIHIVYNVLAAPSEKKHATLGETVDPLVLSWPFTTTPVLNGSGRPSAHLVIDSRDVDPEVLEAFDEVLYGTNTTTPQLPTPGQLKVLLGL